MRRGTTTLLLAVLLGGAGGCTDASGLDRGAGPEARPSLGAAPAEASPDYDFALGRAGARRALNGRHQLAVAVGPQGLRLEPTSASASPAWWLELRLAAIGRPGLLASVEAPAVGPHARGAVASLEHDGIGGAGHVKEWYANGPRGIEQGFVVDEAPLRTRATELELVVAVDGLEPVLAPDGSAVSLLQPSGALALHYTDLHAEDAAGRALPARLDVEAGAIHLRIDDAGASYPVRIDPLVWADEQKRWAQDGQADALFGDAMALQGDVAVVGAQSHGGVGHAYVFMRGAAAWPTWPVILTGGAAADEALGAAVSVHGDTILVGVPGLDGPGENAGCVYPFYRTATSWNRGNCFQPAGLAAGDQLGGAVSLSGDTALVGASWDDDRATDGGAAYVFVRSAWSWPEQQALTASDGADYDIFGCSVALDGDTAFIGAREDDDRGSHSGGAYVFVRAAGSFAEAQKLTASDGAAWDEFGISVALDGDTALVGARYADGREAGTGAVYVFVRSAGSFAEAQKLTAADGAGSDDFGMSVALDGAAALVGAPEYDPHPVGGAGPGMAYLFTRAAALWAEAQQLTASDGIAYDEFGMSVALSGDSALVGQPIGDGAVANSGAAYFFRPVATDGEACSGDEQCRSGHCVDDVCCAVLCDALCEACSQGKTGQPDGQCGFVSVDTDPDSECTPAGRCDGAGACRTASGEGCTAGAECATDLCVDDVCCDAACDGLCEACTAALKGAGEDGRCEPIAPGGDPEDECVQDPGYPASCGPDGACDGEGHCRAHALPGVECAPAWCTDGEEQGAGLCDGVGQCVLPETVECSPYVCDPTACKTGCSVAEDCVAPYQCDQEGHCSLLVECDGDHQVLRPDGSVDQDCSPFKCTEGGGCLGACSSGAECVTGYVCSATGQCVEPTSQAAGGDEGGCSCRLGRRSSAGGCLAGALGLAGLGLAAARRRRRPLAREPERARERGARRP